MSKKYVIGVDFGTLSARALLVDAENGAELAAAVEDYAHGVMDVTLGDVCLPADFALQHPADYIHALGKTVRAVIDASGVCATDIVGIGIDFTTCTLIPVKADGTPLCFDPEFENDPQRIWQTNMFGTTLYELVSEGLYGKLQNMPEEARSKLSETLCRIVNEGTNGLVCILL